MTHRSTIGYEGSVEQAEEQKAAAAAVELRASVDQERQATIDYADEAALNGRLFGQTLAAEERLAAREWEIERTRRRFDRRAESDREARTRGVLEARARDQRRAFGERAGSVHPSLCERGADPRSRLPREELAAVNQQAARLAERYPERSRIAIGRRLARELRAGVDLAGAVLTVEDDLAMGPGAGVPIGKLDAVDRHEVDVAGVIEVLWEPSHGAIAQVGLIADGTGQTKFTSWRRSRQPRVAEGEAVRFLSAARNWYQGRCSLALTGDSVVIFPERSG